MSHLYDLDGPPGMCRAVPTDFTGSPWSDRAQHGGPINALVTHETRRLVRATTEAPMRLARLTVELLKPVPKVPLLVECRVVRLGRTVAVVDATLTPDSADTPAATGRVLFAAPNPAVQVPNHTSATPIGTYPEDPFTSADFVDILPPGFHSHIRQQMSNDSTDPMTWLTSGVEAFGPAEDFDPTLRCAAAADMATVVSTRLRKVASGAVDTDADLAMTYLNSDTTMHLVRPPVGRWFALATPDQVILDGIGMSSVELYDVEGRLGRATHTAVSSGRS